MNTNLFHNIANVASLGLAGTTAMLLASGCHQGADGAFDCSTSWINPTYTTAAIATLQVIKLLVNILRDGLDGLVRPQPPVEQRVIHSRRRQGQTVHDRATVP
ncbi:conserved exported hypothetical protein [Bradyrhizobium sp. ORS 375]|uniref:hypothetical protein n=1 Tax=Bradyrhizobium sp. (strain ORS 375) TaxID=566679 RepID=UPI000240588D|nr:hypothetical protein [Bradyrhizobium sp. ORS 375]CCD94192.1 conserved exported hypothetical protein [Bradyrhizobium sp. ORS 375]